MKQNTLDSQCTRKFTLSHFNFVQKFMKSEPFLFMKQDLHRMVSIFAHLFWNKQWLQGNSYLYSIFLYISKFYKPCGQWCLSHCFIILVVLCEHEIWKKIIRYKMWRKRASAQANLATLFYFTFFNNNKMQTLQLLLYFNFSF